MSVILAARHSLGFSRLCELFDGLEVTTYSSCGINVPISVPFKDLRIMVQALYANNVSYMYENPAYSSKLVFKAFQSCLKLTFQSCLELKCRYTKFANYSKNDHL